MDDSNYAHLYQKSLNSDYQTFDQYIAFKPKGDVYHNTAKQITSINNVRGCGDCIRGGYIYCHKAGIFGTNITASEQFESVCCKDKDLCKNILTDTQWKCSSEYKDEFYKYNICPSRLDKCDGDSWIKIGEPNKG